MRIAWLLLPCVLLAGCSSANSPRVRAAGTYTGRFAIQSVGEKTDPALIKANEMKGGLELYLTADKFILNMMTKHQKYTVTGRWTAAKGGRITLTADGYSFDNPSEEDQKALGLHIVQPDAIRAVFGHPVALDESADRRKLTGLDTSLGNLVGRYEFERPIPH